MKKLFCLLLTVCLYVTDHCVDKYIYTYFNDNTHLKWDITKLTDGSWHFTEYEYNKDQSFYTIAKEEQATDDRVQFITNMVQKLSIDPEIRYQNIIQLLDEETVTFLKNKEFFSVNLDDTSFIFILTLVEKQDCIEVIARMATPEERNLYIKIKAFEYVAIKKTLEANQQHN